MVGAVCVFREDETRRKLGAGSGVAMCRLPSLFSSPQDMVIMRAVQERELSASLAFLRRLAHRLATNATEKGTP